MRFAGCKNKFAGRQFNSAVRYYHRGGISKVWSLKCGRKKGPKKTIFYNKRETRRNFFLKRPVKTSKTQVGTNSFEDTKNSFRDVLHDVVHKA